MKNKLKIGVIGSVMAAILLLYSCADDFLVVAPTGQLSVALLAGKQGIDAAVISTYSQVNGRANRMASPSNWVWGSIRGGDANKGTDPGDFSDINPIQIYEALPTQGVISDKYNGNYEGVARANAVMRLLASADPAVSAADKTSFEAQAKFLRAHFYFELKRAFGDTPYVDENVDYGTGIEKVPNNVDLWPKIEADLDFAIANLPATQGQVGRVNSWAAKAYKAKVLLYQKKFAAAKALFDDIIANGRTSNNKKYALVPKYADVFKAENDNNEESVWAYQAAANTGNVNNANPEFDLNYPHGSGSAGPGNCCGFFQPSFSMANAFRTVSGLPLLDGSYNTGANQLKTDFGVVAKDPFVQDAGEVDPRLDHSIGRRYIQYLDWQPHPGSAWIRNQPNGGPYAPKKYVYYKSEIGKTQDNSTWTPGYTAVNYTIIRFADVLLMAAEAEIEVGSLATAHAYINQVRARAANPAGFVMGLVTGPGPGGDNLKPVVNPALPAANYVINQYAAVGTKAQMIDRVRMERKLELSGEGHRFFDNVRWGIAKSEADAFLAYEKKFLPITYADSKFDAGRDELLPIPQNQIDLLGADVLKQNPGFN
jgi:starch-binding outer membrane protein, SusD/RagB family